MYRAGLLSLQAEWTFYPISKVKIPTHKRLEFNSYVIFIYDKLTINLQFQRSDQYAVHRSISAPKSYSMRVQSRPVECCKPPPRFSPSRLGNTCPLYNPSLQVTPNEVIHWSQTWRSWRPIHRIGKC